MIPIISEIFISCIIGSMVGSFLGVLAWLILMERRK